MAKTLSKTGIETDGAIKAAHVTQSIDALTGTDAYNVTISGSLNINNAPVTNLTASGNISASGDVIADNLYIGAGKIYGNEAYNNYLTFNASSSIFKIQNKTYVKFDGSSAQREVTINEGTNDIDFVVKGEDNNPLLHADANTGKIGTNGIGTPLADVHIGGNLLTDSHITASGNISSSGDITLGHTTNFSGYAAGTTPYIFTNQSYASSGDYSLGFLIATGSTVDGTVMKISGSEGNSFVGIGVPYTTPLTKALTVHGDISASSDVIATNISASDDITVGDKLIIDGTISGSGQMNLKLNTISVANRSDADVTKTLTAATYPNGSLLSLTCNNTNGLGGSRDLQLTLPAVAVSAGRNLSAVVKEAANSQCELKIVSTDSGVLQGLIVNEADGRTAISNRTNIVIGTSDTDRGDRFDLMCDGTYWYVYGFRLGAEADISLS